MIAFKSTLVILVFIILSCNSNKQQDKLKLEIPKALEDKNSFYRIVSKGGSYDDMVESLYSELVSKNIDLKDLENKINELRNNKNNVNNLFDKYNSKNQSYFSSANGHIVTIKDSILKEKMKVLIATQLDRYNSSIAKHQEFLKLIEEKQMTITDLHTVVKIVKTLPLIDKYQKDNVPNTKQLEEYIKQQNETIRLAKDISNK